MECFQFQEARDHFYASLCDYRIELERPINLYVSQDIYLPTIIHERE